MDTTTKVRVPPGNNREASEGVPIGLIRPASLTGNPIGSPRLIWLWEPL